MRGPIGATVALILGATMPRQAGASDYDHARFRIIVANPAQVVGIIEDGATEQVKAGPPRLAAFAIYTPSPLDVPAADGRFVGKADLSVFRVMVDCDGWKIKALAADYFLTPGKARLHHVDYDKALYMPAEEGPPDVIADQVCGKAGAPHATSAVYPGLDGFVAAAKARF